MTPKIRKIKIRTVFVTLFKLLNILEYRAMRNKVKDYEKNDVKKR